MNFMKSMLVVELSVIVLVYCLPVQVQADRFTGLCHSGYPRRVSYNKTGHCYQVGTRGPCGKLMVIRSDPYNPNVGVCACKDLGTSNCAGRPLIYSHPTDRCYFAYSQGPCRKGQWLTQTKSGQSQCRKNPCPIVEDQRSLLHSESAENDFFFAINNQCFLTGTRSVCDRGEKVFFLGTDRYPLCLPYDPTNCYNKKGSGSGGALGGFGVATDEI